MVRRRVNYHFGLLHLLLLLLQLRLLLRLAVVVLCLLQLPREQKVHRLGEAEAEVRGQRLHHVKRVGGVPIHRL